MKRIIAFFGCLLVLLLASIAMPGGSSEAQKSEITLEFLDVGQGEAILIRSPEGKTALVDAGSSKDIVKVLGKRGVKKIDLAVVSHHHADHVGGMEAVIEKYEPKYYMDSGSAHTSKTYKRVLAAVKEAKCKLVRPKKTEERKVELGSVVLRLFPQPPEDEDNENNNSIGMRVEFGEFSALLTGDSEDDERAWWKQHADKSLFSNVTIIKLAHHGSQNGTDAGWLKAANPKQAIASCGLNNSYGHPHKETLTLLKKHEVPLKRTDQDGTIVIKSDGKAWRVVEDGGEGEGATVFLRPTRQGEGARKITSVASR